MTTIETVRILAGKLDNILAHMDEKYADPEYPFVGGHPNSNSYLPMMETSAMGNAAIWDAISNLCSQAASVIEEISPAYNKAQSQNPEAESLLAKLYSHDIYTVEDLENRFQSVAGEMSENDRKIVEMAKSYDCETASELENRLVQANHCEEYEDVILAHDIECFPAGLNDALDKLDNLPDLDDINDRLSEIIGDLDCIRDDINY